MKKLVVFLLVLLGFLQFQLWLKPGGIRQTRELREAISFQTQENKALSTRNRRLQLEVSDLKTGVVAIESRARRDLGMIRDDETFFQFVDH